MKTYSQSSPPPVRVVKKKSQGLVKPDEALSVRDIFKRFLKTGNTGNVVQNEPQYPDQETLTHDSPDFHKLSNLDKMQRADLLAETDKAVKKESKRRKDAEIAAAKAEKEAADQAAEAAKKNLA